MGGVPAKRTGSIVYDLPRCRARSFFSRMIEAQLVTGATQDMRILTGSALCAALAAKSAATTLANINLDKRMRSSWWVWRRLVDFDATLQSGSALGKGRNWRRRDDGLRRTATARPPPARAPWFRSRRGR